MSDSAEVPSNQALAELMRDLLQRVYTVYGPRAQRLDYHLLVLAIPKFPANIEAITDLDDVLTVCELVRQYANNAETQEMARRSEQARLLNAPGETEKEPET